MPYSYHKEGDKYVVTKKDTGKEVGRTKGTKEAVNKYLAALHINANKNKTMKKSELTKMIQEVIKEVLSEQATNNVKIPLHIEAFAKRKGVLPLVKKVASWANSCNKIIHGGVAVGKDYGTLVLDLSREDGAIRINLDDQTVELYGEPVRNFNEFEKVWLDQMTADEIEKDNNQFRREAGVDESVDYDTAVAYRLTVPGNRDEAMISIKALLDNLTTGKSKKFPEVKVTMLPSKGNPNDLILKLNGPGAFSMSKDIKARPELKGVKISKYTPQLTKIS